MAKLIIIATDHQLHEVALFNASLTIGRSAEAQLTIDDPSLSRRHCEFKPYGDHWTLADLGSFNGTFINNMTVSEQVLQAGDRIQFGSNLAYFVPTTATGAAPAPVLDPATLTAQELASAKVRNFGALLQISKAVNSELDQDKLLTMIIDKSLELMNAQRGFLILAENGQLVFRVARHRGGEEVEDAESQISKSVLQKVTETGESVLTMNAQNDLGSFKSIVALEVRSLLCVPLHVKDTIIGALYVDSHIAEQEFTNESLNLLQAFSDQAAVALENARLYEAAVDAHEQEERVRRIFQKYVPADVVKQVLNQAEGELLSAKLTATVLFSDIRNFTATSERMVPEAVVAFLNDYLQRMVDVVFNAGGIVDKFVGDAVMAIWGAPIPKPDDANRAVRASLLMLEEVERFNLQQHAKGETEVRIGIGLHTGELIAGNMGSDKKMEYTVIGDTVNVASRVESLNKPLGTCLLVTEACMIAAGPEHFLFRTMPPVAVKGKTDKLIVHEVTGLRPAHMPPVSLEDSRPIETDELSLEIEF